jgi:hypothetical protein
MFELASEELDDLRCHFGVLGRANVASGPHNAVNFRKIPLPKPSPRGKAESRKA